MDTIEARRQVPDVEARRQDCMKNIHRRDLHPLGASHFTRLNVGYYRALNTVCGAPHIGMAADSHGAEGRIYDAIPLPVIRKKLIARHRESAP